MRDDAVLGRGQERREKGGESKRKGRKGRKREGRKKKGP